MFRPRVLYDIHNVLRELVLKAYEFLRKCLAPYWSFFLLVCLFCDFKHKGGEGDKGWSNCSEGLVEWATTLQFWKPLGCHNGKLILSSLSAVRAIIPYRRYVLGWLCGHRRVQDGGKCPGGHVVNLRVIVYIWVQYIR